MIEFRTNATFPLEAKGVTTTCTVERGAQCHANVRCYVIKADTNFTEVADIQLKEGTVRGVPCASFMFIDLMDAIP